MKTTIEQVKEFHEKYGHAVEDTPNLSNPQLNDFRLALLSEELDELDQALAHGEKVDVLDALCDLQYVLDGAFLALGFWKVKDEAFRRVHENNMNKSATGDIAKPSKPVGWTPPKLDDLAR